MPPRSSDAFACLGLACVLTMVNALKPLVVDDTAYFVFARHLSQHPFDPYGFELFWTDRPRPAGEVILPPVVPYWLALGMALFGENLVLLKLWQFPFAWLLALSSVSLLRRFLRHPTRWHYVVLVLGPGVLPFWNFMLDVPALSLELTAVALFLQKPAGWFRVLVIGLLVGLALQTKYSVLLLPLMLFLIGVLRKRIGEAAAVVLIGCTLFAAWELWLLSQYGYSHFVFHLTDPARPSESRGRFVLPLLTHQGLTLGWVALLVVRLRWTKRLLVLLAVAWGCVLFGSHEGPIKLTNLFFLSLGATAGIVLLRTSYWELSRHSWRSRVLLIWLAIELLAYFAVSPFPAGRRVLAVSFVASLLVFRMVERQRLSARLPFVYALLSGVIVFAIDVWDAKAERDVPREISARLAELSPRGRGYFVGHWGFQYYAEREGLTYLRVGETELQPGDWLAVPITSRPSHEPVDIDATRCRAVQDVVADDVLRTSTIPTLYGGRAPLETRTGPRLWYRVYLVTGTWRVRPKE